MAKRPVFIPDFTGDNLFFEQSIQFPWAGGFAPIQKKKNITALHRAANKKGLANILEISTKSDEQIGKRLSAFNLKYPIDGTDYPLESVYQGSKVFADGGPFPHIFDYAPHHAKKFIWQSNFGTMTGYHLGGVDYPLSPPNCFYDWLYIRALKDHADWIESNVKFDAFTDIEFNPAKQFNCQARSFAIYLSLIKKGKLAVSASDFDYFRAMVQVI